MPYFLSRLCSISPNHQDRLFISRFFYSHTLAVSWLLLQLYQLSLQPRVLNSLNGLDTLAFIFKEAIGPIMIISPWIVSYILQRMPLGNYCAPLIARFCQCLSLPCCPWPHTYVSPPNNPIIIHRNPAQSLEIVVRKSNGLEGL